MSNLNWKYEIRNTKYISLLTSAATEVWQKSHFRPPMLPTTRKRAKVSSLPRKVLQEDLSFPLRRCRQGIPGFLLRTREKVPVATAGSSNRRLHRCTRRQKEKKSSLTGAEKAIDHLHHRYHFPSLLHFRESEGRPPNNCGRDGKEVNGCCGHLRVSLWSRRYFFNGTVEHSESCVSGMISTCIA